MFLLVVMCMSLDMETPIGYIDIKSSPAYCFVQKRPDTYCAHKTPMPFETEITNIGRAIDIKTGVFIAPKPGIYFLAFSGITHNFARGAEINPQLNGINVACGLSPGVIKERGLTMAKSLHFGFRRTIMFP